MAEQNEMPWAEIERRWTALGEVEQEFIVLANDALAASAQTTGGDKQGLRSRSATYFEAAKRLGEAMGGQDD